MRFKTRVITRFVPAICIISGLIAVFVAKTNFGWVFVGGGVLAQILFLYSGRSKDGQENNSKPKA